MVKSAFSRAAAMARRQSEEDFYTNLQAPLPEATVAERLREIGVAPHPDLTAWFALHNGGHTPGPLYWELHSLTQAEAERLELQQMTVGAPAVAAWLPIRSTGQVFTVVDTKSGRVLDYDIVMGLAEAAPSLAAWIDQEIREAGGETGDLGHPPPTRHPLPFPEPAPPPVTTVASTAPAVRATTSREPETRPATARWTAAGKIRKWQLLGNGSVLVSVNPGNAMDLVVVDPRDGTGTRVFSRPEPTYQLQTFQANADQTLVFLNGVVFDATAATARELRDIWPGADPESELKFIGDTRSVVLGAPNGRTHVVHLDTGAAREVAPNPGVAGQHLLWYTDDRVSGETFDGLQPFEATAASLGLSNFDTHPNWFKTSADGSFSVTPMTKDRYHVAVDLHSGHVRLLAALNPAVNCSHSVIAVAPDGSSLIARNFNYPTAQMMLVPTDGTPAINFGLPAPDNAVPGTVSPDGRFYAQLGQNEQHRFVIELIDLADLSSTSIPARSADTEEVGLDIFHAPGHILFRDRSSDDVMSLFVAATGPNGLGQPVRLNGSVAAEPVPGVYPLSDGRRTTWFGDHAPHWAGLDGSAPGRFDVHLDNWHQWAVTASDHIVAKPGDYLDFLAL